jgi:Family of unknown function (DUF6494)
MGRQDALFVHIEMIEFFGRRHAAVRDMMLCLFSLFPGMRGTVMEAIMNEDVLNMSVRKFLKKVGVTSQREIEDAIRSAVGSGRLKGNETLPAKVTLTVGGIDLSVEIEGTVELG